MTLRCHDEMGRGGRHERDVHGGGAVTKNDEKEYLTDPTSNNDRSLKNLLATRETLRDPFI